MTAAVSLKKLLLVSAPWVFVIRAAGAALFVSVAVFIAKALDVNDAGEYFLLTTIAVILATISRFGTDSILVNDVARASGLDEKANIFNQALLLVLSFSSLTVVIVMGLTRLAEYVLGLELFRDYAVLVLLSVIPFSLITSYSEYLKGLGKTAVSSFFRFLCVPLILFVSLVSIDSELNLSMVCRIYTASILISCLILILVASSAKFKASRLDIQGLKLIIVRAIPLVLVALCGLMIGWFDTLFIGLFSGKAQVAHYTVAARFSMLVGFISVATQAVLSAQIAKLIQLNKLNELTVLLSRASLLSSAVALIVIIVYGVFGEYILGFVGPLYNSAFVIVILLSLAHWVNVSFGPVGFILVALNDGVFYSKVYLFVSAISVALYILTIPLWGAVAAATVAIISFSSVNLVCYFRISRHHGISYLFCR